MIILVPMRESVFAAYIDEAIRTYARDKVRSGQWTEEASLRLARDGFNALLPEGLATPDNHLFTIRDPATQADVGTLWFAIQERAGRKIAYVYDVLIAKEFQRMGHATHAFEALEEEVRSLGLSGIALHVFGHNAGAQALYAKLGYRPTNINMFKKVGPD